MLIGQTKFCVKCSWGNRVCCDKPAPPGLPHRFGIAWIQSRVLEPDDQELSIANRSAAAGIADGRHEAIAQALDTLPAAERAAFIAATEKLLAALVAGPEDALRVCRLCDETVCTRCPVDICLGGTCD